MESNEYIPIYFVDHSSDCSYAHKAVNVQNANGKVMLIASDSNIIEEEYNVDDIIEKPSIPTIIVTKDFGDIVREYSKYSENAKNKDAIEYKEKCNKSSTILKLGLLALRKINSFLI